MTCAKGGQAIRATANRVAIKFYGGRAAFHFGCFGGFLRDGAAEELERRAWRESTTAQPAAPAAGRARGEEYQDEPE